MAVQLLVCIDEEQVCGLEFQREIGEGRCPKHCFGEIVAQRNLFHAYEVAFCRAVARVVVGVVGYAEVPVRGKAAVGQYGRNRGCFFVAGLHPAVLKLLGHRGEVVVLCAEDAV